MFLFRFLNIIHTYIYDTHKDNNSNNHSTWFITPFVRNYNVIHLELTTFSINEGIREEIRALQRALADQSHLSSIIFP